MTCSTGSHHARWFGVGLACTLGIACDRRAELESCNIAQKTCQIDVYYAVARLRGDGYDPFEGLPPVRTVSIDQYRQESLTADAPSAAPLAPNEPRRDGAVDPWDIALQWFGLLEPEDATEAQARGDDRLANVAAFYSSRTQQVTVIDRGEKRDNRSDTTLLAHELVHAFQDNEVGATISDPSSDGNFAGRAYTEGEAVLYEKLAGAEIDGVAPNSLLWDEYYSNWLKGLRESIGKDPSPFNGVSWFVYPFGASLLTHGWLRGGNAAVRHLSANFPTDAITFMANFSGIEMSSDMPALACQVSEPAPGFSRVGLDRFGAMQLYAFLVASGAGEDAAWQRSLAWRDDLLHLYFAADRGEVAVSWRIRLADEGTAQSIVDAAAQRPALRASRRGVDALIVASDPSAAAWTGCQ